MDKYLLVMTGGAIGALARYVASVAIMQRFSGRFPLGTFLVNVSGCFLIGLLMTLFTGRPQVHPNWRLLLVVGVLGGYTTFSSFAWETLQAFRSGGRWIGLMNAVASVVCGYAAVWIGAALMDRR